MTEDRLRSVAETSVLTTWMDGHFLRSSVPRSISSLTRRPEPRRRPAFPVGAQGRRLALEMEHDHLGKDLPVPAVPLKGELNVGPGRVAVLERIIDAGDSRGRSSPLPWNSWKKPIGT